MIYPSIFNDVVGPVMRGPSSSHCAAANRIGRLARDLMGGQLKRVKAWFDTKGSLATTHESQGSDMGLLGGLAGLDAEDERLVQYRQAVREAGISFQMETGQYGDTHPNTYNLELSNDNEIHTMKAISTGGGMIEIISLDGIDVSMAGDYHETLIFITADLDDDAIGEILDSVKLKDWRRYQGFIHIKTPRALEPQVIRELGSGFHIPARRIRCLLPVLPVLSWKDMKVPYLTHREMEAYNHKSNLDLWELAVHYESVRGNMPAADVLERMRQIVRLMRRSIDDGIAGKQADFEDRILGYQSGNFKTQMESGRLLDGGMLNRMVLYTTAMMETKSSMGLIVAAPTAGSCGALPGALLAAADELKRGDEDIAKAMLAAGLIGIFIAHGSSFAAEVCGCQAECGSASGMAAAGLVALAGGNAAQAVNAASMALQNIFGMTCDPVANRVEVPCLGKNVLAASNALTCANMALAGFDAVIPLDEVIQAMDKVGKSLPFQLRCTALGGLSVTATSKKISKKLQSR